MQFKTRLEIDFQQIVSQRRDTVKGFFWYHSIDEKLLS